MTDIAPQELRRLLEADGCFLLDIRDPEELAAGRIIGSVSVPMEQLERKLAGMRKDAPLVLYCRTGRRSRAAAQALREAGYTDVRSLAGGIEAWRQER